MPNLIKRNFIKTIAGLLFGLCVLFAMAGNVMAVTSNTVPLYLTDNNQEILRKYPSAFCPTSNSNLTLHGMKDGKNGDYRVVDDTFGHKTIWISPRYDHSGDIYVEGTNMGYYNAGTDTNPNYQPFDAKFTFEWNEKLVINKEHISPYIGISISFEKNALSFRMRETSYSVKIELFKADGKFKTPISGNFNMFFADIDAYQAYGFREIGSTNLNFYRLPVSNGQIAEANSGSGSTKTHWVYDVTNQGRNGEASFTKGAAAVLADNLSKFTFIIKSPKDSSNSYGWHIPTNNKNYNNKILEAYQKERKVFKGESPYTDRLAAAQALGKGYIEIAGGFMGTLRPKKIQKAESKNGSKMEDSPMTLAEGTEGYFYHLTIPLPKNLATPDLRLTKITIEDSLPNQVSLAGAPTVFDKVSGKTITNLFNNNSTSSKVKLDAKNAKTLNELPHVLYVTIPVRLNLKNVYDGGTSGNYYQWDNTASLSITYPKASGTGSETLSSNTVVTRYPMKKVAASLNKTDALSGDPLKGGTFYVERWSDSANSNRGAYVTTGRVKMTDKGNGTYSTTKTFAKTGDNLGGKFRIVETKAPPAHTFTPTTGTYRVIKEFTVDEAYKKENNTIKATAKNEFKEFKVEVTKKNSAGSNLSGATFYVIPYNKNTKKYNWSKKQALAYSGGKYTYTITSSSDIKWNYINEGKYQVVEAVPPTGYSLPKKTTTDSNGTYYVVDNFKIDTSSLTKTSVSYTVTNIEIPTPGKVTIRKTNSSGTDITGAEFKVYAYDVKNSKYDTTPTATLTYNSSTKRYESGLLYRYDANNTPSGKKQNNGKFKVVETKAPDGYMKATWSQEFTITNPTTASSRTSVQSSNNFAYTVSNPETTFIIQKKNRDGANLQGVRFAFGKSKTSTTTYTTNASGQVVISPVKAGTYYFQETSAPNGYAVDSTWHTITVKSDGTISGTGVVRETGSNSNKFTYTMTNDHQQNLEINKTDLVTGTTITESKLKVATFNVYEGVSGGGYSTSVYAKVVYSSSLHKLVDVKTGQLVLLRYTTANGGRFKITETKQPTGYILDESGITFTITKSPASGEGNKVITYPNDKPDPNPNFSILKQNANGEEIEGVTFEFKKSGGTATSKTTDATGKVTWASLESGTWSFREVSAPAGYKVDSKWRNISVSANGITGTGLTLTKSGKTFTYTMKNDHEQAVELTKKDAETGNEIAENKLEKALFSLYEWNGSGYDATPIAKINYSSSLHKFVNAKTQQVVKLTYTDTNVGKFRIIEDKAPDGYQLDTAPHDFTIAKVPVNGEGAKEVEIYNTPKQKNKVNFLIKKTNMNGAPIQGVVFSFGASKTDTADYSTNASGIATIENLAEGTYYFREKSAPSDYAVDSTWHSIIVDSEGALSGEGVVFDEFTTTYSTAPPAGATLFGKNYYKITDTSLSWHDAKAAAEAAGGHLATITSAEEEAFVESVAALGNKYHYWLGLTDEAEEGNWSRWITGEPVSYTNWAYGQPNNNGGNTSSNGEQDYVSLTIKDSETGLTTDTGWKNHWSDDFPFAVGLTGESGLWNGEYYGYITEWDGKATSVYSYTMKDPNAVTLELTKLDSASTAIAEEKLTAAKFDLYEWDGTAFNSSKTIIYSTSLHKFVDAATGQSVKLLYSTTNEGKFRIKETVAPAGYILDETEHLVTIESTTTGVKNVTITNVPNNFTLKKTNVSNTAIANVTFEIGTAKSSTTDYTTNSSGEIGLTALKPGTWYIREKSAPNGYHVDNTWHEISVANNGAITGTGVSKVNDNSFTLTLKNAHEQELLLTKKDSSGSAIPESKLSTAKFALYEKNGGSYGTTPTATLVYDSTIHKFVDELTGQPYKLVYTTENSGTFKIKETTPPAGYILDSADHEFTITNVPANEEGAKEVEIRNTPNTFVLLKKNEAGDTLQNVSFAFGTDKATATTSTTDANGKITMTALEPGTYYIQERTAPAGYKVDETWYTITVAKDGTISGDNVAASGNTFTLTKVNEFLYDVQLTKTDNSGNPIDASALAEARFALYEGSGASYKTSPSATLIYDSALNKFVDAKTGVPATVKYTTENGGRFKVVETVAPTGYVLDSSDHAFTVNRTAASNVVSLTIQNVPNKLRIIKTDTSHNRLSGATFKLYKEGQESTTRVLNVNANGVAESEKLSPGVWCYQETIAPEDYELNDKIYRVTVGADGKIEGSATYEVEAQNGKARDLEIIKKDAETGEEWADGSDFPDGTEFYIYEWDEENGTYSDTPTIHVIRGN